MLLGLNGTLCFESGLGFPLPWRLYASEFELTS